MSAYYPRLPVPPGAAHIARLLLRVMVGLPLLSWFVFSAMLSIWSSSTSSSFATMLWNAGSAVLFLGAAVFLTWVLLAQILSGAGPASGSAHGGRGSPPPAPPLTGAPCPVPIRPRPHLVRSAAEPLPCDRERSD